MNKIVGMVLTYNALVLILMSALIWHFENGWPVLMVFLLAEVGKNNEHRKSSIQQSSKP
jgi:hypothetical protein